MPGQSGTLHAYGKLADSGEYAQLAQFSLVSIGRKLASNKLVKAVEKLFCVCPALAFQALRHHGSGGLGDRAAGTLERDVANLAALFHVEINGEVVAAQRVVAFSFAVRCRKLAEVARSFAVLQDHFLIKLAQVS